MTEEERQFIEREKLRWEGRQELSEKRYYSSDTTNDGRGLYSEHVPWEMPKEKGWTQVSKKGVMA